MAGFENSLKSCCKLLLAVFFALVFVGFPAAKAEFVSGNWCYDFTKELKLGSQGKDVDALQIILKKEGFFVPDDEIRTDYFGEFTAAALVAFQEKYKDDILAPRSLQHGTGYVDKNTLAKLNQLYTCKPSCQDSDNGKDYYQAAKVEINRLQSWQDVCLNSGQVIEGYCASGAVPAVKTIVFNCPNGCLNGACQKAIKIISPIGKKIFKEGSVAVLQWEGQGLPGDETAQIFIIRSDGLGKKIAEVPASQNSYKWQVAADFKNWDPDAVNKSQLTPVFFTSKPADPAVFGYKIEIIGQKSRAYAISDNSFAITQSAIVNLEMQDELNVSSAGFGVKVCNRGDKDLQAEGKTVKAKITVFLGGDSPATEKTFTKTVDLFGAQLAAGQCSDSQNFLYNDFQINQNKQFQVKVELDPNDDFDEFRIVNEKMYLLTPLFGINIISPNGGERWGQGFRHRIIIGVNGPEVWTKAEIKLVNKETSEETPIDVIHIWPPSGEYWWTIPLGLAIGEHYVIKVASQEILTKEDESDQEFAVIEPQVACTDSDGGSNYFTKGTADGIFAAMKDNQEVRTGEDFCLDENTLVEYFCKDDYVYSEHYQCPTDCDSGICRKLIKITSPKAGDILEQGKSYEIKWELLNQDSAVPIKIILKGPTGEKIIADNVNNGIYKWLVPLDIQASSNDNNLNYKILVSLGQDDNMKDQTSVFSIVAPKTTKSVVFKTTKPVQNAPAPTITKKPVATPAPQVQKPSAKPTQTASVLQQILNFIAKMRELQQK